MYEIFEQLCALKGVTPYRVAKETGLTTSSLSSWKAGRYSPKTEKLQKLAEYFGVSLEYMMTGREPEGYYDNDETAHIAQEIHDNREMRMLFSAAKDVSPEKLKQLYEILLIMKRGEEND